MEPQETERLRRLYRSRFDPSADHRDRVWRILTSRVFQKLIPVDGTVLDLGCGRGSFINHIAAGRKFALDLNPDAKNHLAGDVLLIRQDSSSPWPLDRESIDVVFTSNFLEHLDSKASVAATLDEAARCLKPAGLLIAMGPNIRHLPGRYWDFWDHHIPFSHLSMVEALRLHGFEIERCVPRFVPYTMVDKRPPPSWMIRLYLRIPLAWRILGKQFLVVARRL